jgi:hypothetical protein
MTPLQIVLLVLVFVAVDFAIIGGIMYAVTSELRELARRLPAREPKPGAVREEFQSFRIGMVGLGGCIHVAVDEDCLHLFPALVPRKMGVKAMSIPWERVVVEKRGRRWVVVSVDGTRIKGPTWCFEVVGEQEVHEAP